MTNQGERVNRRTKVLELRDDESTPYAILSHRWASTEVDYEEIVDLAKVDAEERDEIHQRLGYKRILDACQQTIENGYNWLWYGNSRVCYAYLHDVFDSTFPTEANMTMYHDFGGWPVWFSRRWTRQEMIAPINFQFFNQSWQPIGDKKMLAPTLSRIARVPLHVLREGFSDSRPCVAQIMSWAASRRTTRVEDKAYSLMGLLDANMPMLYGEGKKAFHRLQLEIIRMSNDQGILRGDMPPEMRGLVNILADDPCFFDDCSEMVLIDYNKFFREVG